MADDLFQGAMPSGKRTRRYVRYQCCKSWHDFGLEYHTDLERWAKLHKLSHSRLMFTENFFAELVGVPQSMSAAMCDVAFDRGWLQVPVLDGHVPDLAGRAWIGKLQSDR